jgi:uncharacterized protein with ATP-grasp and redox domains
MRVHLDCIPCLQRQALQALRFVTDDVEIQERILRHVIAILEATDWTGTPPQMAHAVHRTVIEECGVEDPYKDVKKKYNDIALNLYPEIKRTVEESSEPLLLAIRMAIAGNIIDFGASSDFDLNKTIVAVASEEFAIFDYSQLETVLENANTMIYLADNTGEIVFDRILLETILDRYNIEKIVFAVKGAPVINDATIEDAKYAGIDRLRGVEFIKVGIGIPNSGIERRSREFQNILDSADLVISKGQGNYEALSDHSGIFFLLMAKCPVIAGDLNVKIGDIVLKGTYT